MLNPEILPLLVLLNENQDLIDGYVIHVCFRNRTKNEHIGLNEVPNSFNKKNRNYPENVVLRMTALTKNIKQLCNKFDEISETCYEQSMKLLDEGYTYESYKFDRIRLRKKFKENSISSTEFQKALSVNKVKLENTKVKIIQTYKPFLDEVYEYTMKNASKDISQLPKYTM